MTIKLHIERVVLDGVPVEHPRVLRRALEKELIQQLRQGSLSREFRKGGAVPYVGGGTIEIGREQNAAKLGSQIAQGVYRGIGGGR
jgi:hypothetical protein